MAPSTVLGFHGKLPSHGDFVRRRVPGDFLGVWDRWLAACIPDSRQALGERWLEAYLTSPLWRLAVSAPACGGPAAGLLMPSVDSVGRYYPLTLVANLPPGVNLLALAAEDGDWFEALEQLALQVLRSDESFDLDGFDREVAALGARLAPRVCDDPEALRDGGLPARLGVGAQADLPAALFAAGQRHLTGAEGFSLWWTEGSERIAPSAFTHPRLPSPERFAAMPDGDWQRHGWDSRELHWDRPREGPPAAVERPPAYRSAAVTHVGKVRTLNEDACLDRPDLGLWVVADGVGGQAAGEVASGGVVQALQGLRAGGDPQERLNAARGTLEAVNAHLRRAAERPGEATNSASTVVALFGGVDACAWIWAGDSRLYPLRDGELVRCTRDHSVVQDMVDAGELTPEQANGHPRANVITRAVGGAAELEPETGFADVRPGDRFLLCSDGVHGCLDDAALHAALSEAGAPETCARRLLDGVLAGAAKDNLTAVVVFVE